MCHMAACTPSCALTCCCADCSLASEGVSTAASWEDWRRYPILVENLVLGGRIVDLLANYTAGEEIKWIMSKYRTDFREHPIFCNSGTLCSRAS
jgi:hypothetical protein